VKQLNNVLEVPTQAIHYNGTTATVTVDTNGSRSTRTVTVGLTTNGLTQITSGVKAGDKVVTTTVQLNRGSGSTTPGGTGGTGGFGGGAGGFGGGGGGFGRGGTGTGGTGTGGTGTGGTGTGGGNG
jgi:hypothetical protein